jgi:hypothetical protein
VQRLRAGAQALGEHVGAEQRRHATYAACYAANPAVGQAAQRAALRGARPRAAA